MALFIETLEALIKQRYESPQEGSYTSKLFSDGTDRILKKVGEEASEVIIAAKNNDSDELKQEELGKRKRIVRIQIRVWILETHLKRHFPI